MKKVNCKLDHLYTELDNMLICYEDTGKDIYLREALKIKEEIIAIRKLQSFKEEVEICC